jgi:hypothetical protein
MGVFLFVWVVCRGMGVDFGEWVLAAVSGLSGEVLLCGEFSDLPVASLLYPSLSFQV